MLLGRTPSTSADAQCVAPTVNSILNITQSRTNPEHSTTCTLENCIECLIFDGTEYCSLCYGDNLGPDIDGHCTSCHIDNCLQCSTDIFNCELCIDGNPPALDKCTEDVFFCIDPHCINCRDGPEFCSVCEPGYYLQEYCISCNYIHFDCLACAEGLCTECYPRDVYDSSICVACDVLGCQYCRILYNDRNKSIIKQCVTCYQGYLLVRDNSLCIKSSETNCAILNCRRCTTTDPIICLECDTFYALYQDACVLCTIPNCLECKIEASQGIVYETCVLCKDGYSYLLRDVYNVTSQGLCVPVFRNISQNINPIILLSFVLVTLGLALLAAGCMFVYRLIEKDEARRN
ncbi:High cysteine protein [Giardia lamblia P15]|uniref:High cysteine protein n=1 Tax=Giardia intestinalis (strain P15) TaxID=658858 RepID=E1EWB0_GIAIA|nr:High cysteine protein [Giardia lamblia P15]